MTRVEPASPSAQSASKEADIEYGHDGRIPIGIWIVWVAFAVFAIVYLSRYAWPDFVVWLHEAQK